MNKLDQIIIEFIKNENNRPVSKKILITKIQKVHKDIEVKNIFHSIRFLEKNKKIVTLISGKLVLPYDSGKIISDSEGTGEISINSYGDGFIKIHNDDSREIFIYRDNVKNALNGDIVEFVETDAVSKNNLTNGIITKVIKRAKDIFVGEFVKTDEGYNVILNDQKVNKKIIIENLSGVVDGHKIVLKAIEYRDDSIIAEVVRIIGHKNDVGIDILSILCDNKIEPEFSKEILDFAHDISKDIPEEERKKRKDLTNLPFITIDPETSKDLDDAICVKKENNDYRLWVSIADVSHYVTPNSLIDVEALKRGTSIYLVNKVVPMLPHNLSNDICSLNPHEERLTLTCEMLIDSNGNFKTIDVYPSIFINKRRFSYDEVNKYFSKELSFEEENLEIIEVLNSSFNLYEILRVNFKKRGYINFDIKEPKIILDDQERPIDIKLYERGDAQMMIENFMVAANEAVTINFQKYKIPFIYRVHDKPDPNKLKSFAVEAKKLNFKIDSEIKEIKPNTIARWIEENKESYSSQLINKLLLRVMAKAEYLTSNIGHFGLASSFYTHFTSPIRRYPDLIVHRLYRMFVFERHLYNDSDRNSLLSQLNNICSLSSSSEQKAVSIEREVNALKFAEYMEKHVGDNFKGVISYITSFGIFIELENSIEGLCRIKNIKINDFFKYNEENTTYIGEKTKTVLSFGLPVLIKVVGANAVSKKIDVEIIDIINGK